MTGNLGVGISGVLLACTFWGSNYVVAKGYDLPKDGVHFAFLMSIGILLMGLFSLLLPSTLQDGDFEALVSPDGLLGGALWACGNFLTVPIIQCLGLGVGLAIWAGVNMIVAFLVGALGMQGLHIPLPKEPLAHPVAGVFGVLFGLVALCLFANIRAGESEEPAVMANVRVRIVLTSAQDTEEQQATTTNTGDQPALPTETPVDQSTLSQPLLEQDHLEMSCPEDSAHIDRPAEELNQEDDFLTGNVPLGVAMAVVAGIFYGFMMVPLAIWNHKVIRNGHIFDRPMPSDMVRAMRFFFSQFAGIFLMSITGFAVYCVVTKNQPKLVPPEATMPSIVCGMLWAVGCAGAMFATCELGNSVGFVLVLNGSFLVNSAWSILVFKEIRGQRNLRLFGGAFLLILFGSLLITISKA